MDERRRQMKKVMRYKDTDGREYLEVAGDGGVTLVKIGGETDNELLVTTYLAKMNV